MTAVALNEVRVQPGGAAVVLEKVVYVPSTRNLTVVMVSPAFPPLLVLVTRNVTGLVVPMTNAAEPGAGLIWVTVN